jgi:two-component system osmolarity sensor histidine kinase EnvZ
VHILEWAGARVELVIVVVVFAVVSGLLLLAWRLRGQLRRADQLRLRAAERRDRFLAEAAGELQAPLDSLRAEVAGLSARNVTGAQLAELTARIDELRSLIGELARLPTRPAESPRDEVDLAELIREVVGTTPFPESGPSVILRAHPATVMGERARLLNGLRILLWVLRRDASELVITVERDHDRARVEIDTRGARAAMQTLEQLPAIDYGLRGSTAPPGTTLALRVADEVARAHGGRVRASSRAAAGERFVLELPASAAVTPSA